jgi:hypothetical protein
MSTTATGLDSSSVCDSTAAACLVQQGYSFLIRYYRSHQSQLNRLQLPEAQTICAAGLTIGVVFEYRSTTAGYFTANQGAQDAADSLAEGAAVGQPNGSAIYFAVDYDANLQTDLTGITAYFQSVVAALRPAYKVGVYGSGAVCGALLDAGLADYAWLSQSTDFSGTATFTRWNIKQGPSQTICGLNADSDTANGDFGGFIIPSA